jgi:hypothetical protein
MASGAIAPFLPLRTLTNPTGHDAWLRRLLVGTDHAENQAEACDDIGGFEKLLLLVQTDREQRRDRVGQDSRFADQRKLAQKRDRHIGLAEKTDRHIGQLEVGIGRGPDSA